MRRIQTNLCRGGTSSFLAVLVVGRFNADREVSLIPLPALKNIVMLYEHDMH